jgi:hypothetical protein
MKVPAVPGGAETPAVVKVPAVPGGVETPAAMEAPGEGDNSRLKIPETRNPKPETRNPKPETRNPKPETRNPALSLPCTFPLYNREEVFTDSDPYVPPECLLYNLMILLNKM